MSQPWSTVAQQWKLEDTTATDPAGGLYGRIDSSALTQLIGAVSDSDRDAKAALQIGRMANFYRQKLLLQFQQTYPNTAMQFMQAMSVKLQQYRGVRSALLNSAGISELSLPVLNQPDGNTWYGDLSTIGDGAMLYYVTDDDPVDGTSGTHAGDADNGAFLVKEPTEKLYINRGTKASPTWVRWDTTGLIDYILNPEELLECGYLRAISYIKGYGTIIDSGDFTQRLDFMPKVQQATMKEVIEAENLAFSLLRVDESADGLLSDTELSRQTRRRYFF